MYPSAITICKTKPTQYSQFEKTEYDSPNVILGNTSPAPERSGDVYRARVNAAVPIICDIIRTAETCTRERVYDEIDILPVIT